MRVRTRLHHPRFSPSVVCRRSTDVLLLFIDSYAKVVLSRGRTWPGLFSSLGDISKVTANLRLRRHGVESREGPDGVKLLELNEDAGAVRTHLLHPDRFWQRSWDGVWDVLVYDVPTRSNNYRTTLARLLHRHRLGCLQRSVWVTPWDFRPLYDDLVQGAGLGTMSYLFESRLVLGQTHEDVVRNAWPWDGIDRDQLDYCLAFSKRMDQLEREQDNATLARLALGEMEAYQQAMSRDPMLPEALLPAAYQGQRVWSHHQEFAALARQRLRAAP